MVLTLARLRSVPVMPWLPSDDLRLVQLFANLLTQ